MSNCFEVTSKFGNICSFKSDSVNKGDKVYTSPQTKPLSDGEIEEVIRKHWNREYGNRNMLTLCKAVLDEADK